MPAGIYRSFLIVLLALLPAVLNAQVSSIVFTTDPQTIKPNELSGPLTIQTQDSSGNSYKTPETIDLEFVSTSPAGEFLGSTGNPVTKTMSTNTANRTFYYRDSELGTFTLTVNAKGRTSGTAWSAEQTIIVSESASATTTEATSTPPATRTSSAKVNTSTITISTHYGAASLTNTETDTKFEVGAGRERMSTVGTPIEFKAGSNKEINNKTIFQWSFGDGAVGSGEVINHSYLYPGEYVVVLNVSGPDGQAVSRTNVRIVPPELSISFVSPERIEITNNSKNETNLFGRAVVSGARIFVFPKDTIIKAGQKISFGSEITGLIPSSATGISLVVVGTEVRPQKVLAEIEEQRLEQIARIQSQLRVLQRQLAGISNQQDSTSVTLAATAPPIVEKLVEPKDNEPQTALVIEAVPESTNGVMSKWLEILKRFFFRTR